MKTSKKVLSVLLAVLMLAATFVVCLVPPAAAEVGTSYQKGDVIEFGSYPQTKVSETTTLRNAANAATWKSYNYYIGNGTDAPVYDGNMYQDDFMKYADFFLNGVKYRAVKFTKYRPRYTGWASSDSHSYQDDNGYYTNRTYYFKYEPLEWRVISKADDGSGFVVCDSLIDAQAFQNVGWDNGTHYNGINSGIHANNYAASTIKSWLNGKFYNTAFNVAQKGKIASTTDNGKVWLLSYDEAGDWFSSDAARKAKGTDYAKCQGLWVSNKSGSVGYSQWLLRTAGHHSYQVCVVDYPGYPFNWNGSGLDNVVNVYETSYGIRPACVLTDVSSDLSQPDDVHTISVSADPSGAGTVSGGGTYGKGETVTLSAVSKTGYYFCDWYYIASNNTKQRVSTNATCTVTVGDTDRTYYAEFLPHSYNVIPVASPSSGGSVTGGGSFKYNTSATVKATASTGYHFVGWYKNGTKVSSSANYTFTVTEDVTLVAEFSKNTYTVTATAGTSGSVSGGGTYEYGDTVTVRATPSTGYHFLGWYKGDSKVSGDANYSFTVTENVTLTAKFTKTTQPDQPDNPGQPDNPQPDPNMCHWCGKVHEGFFQKIIGFFHNILAKIFGAKY